MERKKEEERQNVLQWTRSLLPRGLYSEMNPPVINVISVHCDVYKMEGWPLSIYLIIFTVSISTHIQSLCSVYRYIPYWFCAIISTENVSFLDISFCNEFKVFCADFCVSVIYYLMRTRVVRMWPSDHPCWRGFRVRKFEIMSSRKCYNRFSNREHRSVWTRDGKYGRCLRYRASRDYLTAPLTVCKAPVVTFCTPGLTFSNSPFCPHSVFMCFVWIWEQTAIISLYSVNWLVFITDTASVTARYEQNI